MVRLDDASVRAIRRTYSAGGITHAELAARYGVVKGTIGWITRGETWTHLLTD
jgi:hypothetical protein